MKRPTEPLLFADPAAWRAWLAAHHATESEVWLVFYKKGSGKRSMTLEEATEEALCFGWVDSVMHGVDAEKYVLRYSPRRRKSIWSESNKRRVEKLIRAGRMAPAGLAAVEAAKANGEWDAAAAREDVSTVPADLEAALKKRKGAWDAFGAWPASKKRMAIYAVTGAKRPETREKRIRAVVDQAAGKG